MPTLNEAAEVLRLRAALRKAEAHMTNPKGGRGCVCRCSVIDGHTGDCPVIAALAADPGPLVAAVEQIAKAVEATICGSCGNRIGWQGEFDAAQKRLGRDDWRTCSGCQSTRAALAAYHAALGGTDEPR